jgi:four helix bundle protein
MERKNVNRGFKKLIVWQDAIDLYVLSKQTFTKLPYIHSKSASNGIDAALSISRNIAEGFCRKSIKEYLHFLNISLASCGELYSTFYAFSKADLISEDEFEKLDKLHYKTENTLINLIKSLQKKAKQNGWTDDFNAEK